MRLLSICLGLLFWVCGIKAQSIQENESDVDATHSVILSENRNNPQAFGVDADEDVVLDEAQLSNQQAILQANAQSLRIGFINFRRIMTSIPQLNAVSSLLEAEFSAQQKALTAKQEEVAQMERELATLERGEAYSDFEKQVIAKRREWLREDAAYRDAYSVRRNEELAKLQRIVVDEIVALAKALDFDIILNDTGVIYVSEEADLTSAVIERLRLL